jgi:hypothetical protein
MYQFEFEELILLADSRAHAEWPGFPRLRIRASIFSLNYGLPSFNNNKMNVTLLRQTEHKHYAFRVLTVKKIRRCNGSNYFCTCCCRVERSLRLCIWKIPDSKLGLGVGSPDWICTWFPWVPQCSLFPWVPQCSLFPWVPHFSLFPWVPHFSLFPWVPQCASDHRRLSARIFQFVIENHHVEV